MKQKIHYFNINSSYVKIIFSVMLTFILCSIGLTAALFSIYSQYVKEINPAKEIIFGVNTGILCSMLVIIIIPIALFASKKMANPLVEMNKVAVAMSKGDFSVRAKDHYQGEIGQLAETLNQLATELSATINSLTIEKNLLNQILNSMSDGLLELDISQKVNLINKPFYEMFGIETYFDLKEEIRELIEKIAIMVINSHKTEVETCTLGNKSILLSGSPILSEQNDIVGTVLLFRDITESERLEQTRRDYVANVSHELRSPLTAVKGLIIPLKEGMVKDEVKRNHFYDVIYSEIERLNRLVNDLFELSRLQSWNKSFDMQTVNIQNILYDQQDKFLLLAKGKNIKLIVNENGDPILVKGNIDRISQVLTIFIDNAIKFSKENSTITLSACIRDNKALVSIHNTGSFIHQEDLPYIFDRFYKADKAHKEQGAGLGLSIAKEVITRMNGKVIAKSDGLNETIFIFKLDKV
ncbi:HAMP domain-containing histidine kinase [Clostridium sp. KNHs205]|uniref:HAMP domain-containing histidine kinase n=1 Tax=Clostridium sp. KNHs205 TaxID=1449050 RepID=UPI00051BDBFA|nr:HAMP domain-containing histidine kinase [Clostridium sp. KNHs205]